MKLIVAIVKPFKISAIMDALEEAGIRRLSVSDVKGFGRQRGHAELYKGSEYQVDFVPKSRGARDPRLFFENSFLAQLR